MRARQRKQKKTVKAYVLPVDPARTSIRFDVHLIQVDINLGDFHLEAVGQKLDGLPDGAIARSPWQRKQGWGSNISFYDAHTKTHLLNRQNDLEILQKVTFLDNIQLASVLPQVIVYRSVCTFNSKVQQSALYQTREV